MSEGLLFTPEFALVARKLRAGGWRAIGLAPAGRNADVRSVALRLGVALAELTGRPIAEVEARRGDAPAAFQDAPYATRWLGDRLAAISPTRADRPGWSIADLERSLALCRPMFEHLLVDLGGLDADGDLERGAAAVDALVVVGRTGEVREKDLVAAQRALAGEKLLGVLLVDKLA